MNYYVFRINYEQDYQMILDEIRNGKLRQGWGAEGMDISNSSEDFSKAWHKVWPDDKANEKYISSKYNNIKIMQSVRPGDLIVIPKTDLKSKCGWRFFTIVECIGNYYFDPIENDFGHCLPVKPVLSCNYDFDNTSRTINAKFKAYQRAVNNVYNNDFILAVDSLVKARENNLQLDLSSETKSIGALSTPTKNVRDAYCDEIVKQINLWQPHHLEKIIEELFTKNGYIKTGNNRYDRNGGDIDIIFNSFIPNTLMGDIFDISKNVHVPEIRVQAKNKKGVDSGDIEGIEQLCKMEGFNSSINIVINTTKEFHEDSIELAAEKGVILINGRSFANLLIKYGIDIFE